MVAEPKQHSPVEKIVRNFLVTEYLADTNYAYDRTGPKRQIVIGHVTGLDEDALIQHDIWGVDKESALGDVLSIMQLYESTFQYQTPYGRLVSGTPANYLWRPDDTYSRYVLDVRVMSTP